MLKKVLIGIAIFIGVALLGIFGVIFYITNFLPDLGEPKQVKVNSSAELIARGEYIVNNVAVCIDCHSQRDWTILSAPLKKGSEGGGGQLWDEKDDFPGRVYAQNISPSSLGSWSDTEIFRAITEGVNKDGDPLFPLMPYHNYAKLDFEDIKAIIAYLRTLKPNSNKVPKSELNFPLNIIVHLIPQKATLGKRPPESNKVEYGKYLTTMASCGDCHTPMEKGKPIPGMEFAGGFKMLLGSGGHIVTPNITPEKETGIGNWSKELFMARFASYRNIDSLPRVKEGEFNTTMPWTFYAQMKDSDLEAIWEYLRTIKPVKNKVSQKFIAPSTAMK